MFHFRDTLAGSTAIARAPALNADRYVRDQFTTFDQATYDSAGAFLVGELERLDPMIHEPLISIQWPRDIDLRTDVQMGDTTSSYTLSTFAMTGGVTPGGLNWASAETTTIPRAQLDITKIVNPLNLVAYEVAYTLPELESARLTGRPIDTQMLAAMNRKHQMDIDQVVYVGDSTISTTGLLNNAGVSNVSNVAVGSGGLMQWVNKSPDEIRADVNELIVSVWKTTGYAAPPTKLLVAPGPFGYVSTTIASSAANTTILRFLEENNVLTAETGQKLEIKSCKWLDKALLTGTYDRMVAYGQRADYVRFPMVPLIPVQPQYSGIWIKVPYFGRLGVIESVYPETLGYRDGIG
jgi:hypothetical protein